jgi:ribosomal protein L40E
LGGTKIKTCPKCNELNGDARTDCWKCKTFLGAVDKYKKICPKCNLIFSQKTENCDKCGGRLSVYSEESTYVTPNSDNSGCWMYVVSVLVPLVGIILGCIYIARKEDDLGKSLIITGVVSNIIAVILLIMLGR